MKKAVCSLIAIVLILVLNSCSAIFPWAMYKSAGYVPDEDAELADECMEQVYVAIKENDKAALKAVFSEKAIEEAEDIDAQIEGFLSLVQGEDFSCIRDESPVVKDDTEDGNDRKQLMTWYTLEIDELKYFVFLVDYPIDTITPDNVGLYSLMVIKAEDEDELTGAIEDWVVPGIRILEPLS